MLAVLARSNVQARGSDEVRVGASIKLVSFVVGLMAAQGAVEDVVLVVARVAHAVGEDDGVPVGVGVGVGVGRHEW